MHPDQLRALAIEAAVRAGDHVRDHRPDRVDVVATKSSEVDVVTAMDRAAERMIIDHVLAARPDDGFFGEEGSTRTTRSGITWVIDPIDGTVNYLYGLDGYAVSVAAVEGEPDPATWTALAGCVYHPAPRLAYHATAGGGAFAGDRPLAGPTDTGLRGALVATGFGYVQERRVKQAAVIAGLLGELRDMRRLGAASLDLCLVGDGRLDAYYERGLHPWDHAAGGLIATEAGAMVTGPDGGRASEEMLVVAGTRLHGELLSRLGDLDAFTDA
ncbi:MAG: inositol monophosphatase family protein [Propionibacterium sp.]|nr:inositol monophosphatase family protein [Propionibacterium sp.]